MSRLLVALSLICFPALAKDGGFIQLDHITRLDISSGNTEDGTSLVIENDTINVDDITLEDESGLNAVSLGIRRSNWQASIRFEEEGDFSTKYVGFDILHAVQNQETAIDEINAKLDGSISPVFLEIAYLKPINEKIELWTMIGFGRTTIDTSDLNAEIVYSANDIENAIVACGYSNSDSSSRFGLGVNLGISDRNTLSLGFTSSEYGEAHFYARDGGGQCSKSKDDLKIKDISADEFRLGFTHRY